VQLGIPRLSQDPTCDPRMEARFMVSLSPASPPWKNRSRDCFRIEVFQTLQSLLAGWLLCNGPRTISDNRFRNRRSPPTLVN